MGDNVGGCPEGSGPEEAHRPATKLTTLAVQVARLLSNRRRRLQVAGLAALALIALLAFVLIPPRTVRIAADGAVTTVSSRTANDTTIVEQAGIELRPGDRVESVSDDTLAVHRATEAFLQLDGETFALRTQARTIEELLTKADVIFGPRDSVLRNGVFVSPGAPVVPPAPLAAVARSVLSVAPAGDEPVTVEVRRAVPFTIVEDGQELALDSSRETIATALRDVGVRLGAGDKIQPPLATELTAGMDVYVEHATTVIVTLPEGKLILYSLESTVGAALEEGGVDLPPSYRLDPPAESPIEAGLAIHVIGVSEKQELEEERIESRTVYQPDSSLPWGERRVVPGQDGMRFRQYNVVYENGQLISRELVDEWYDPEPSDTVIYYSAADEPPTAPGGIPDGLNVLQTLRVYATWYNAASAGRPPSDPAYGITATGVPVDRGIVAVDPSVIPLGTRLYIPGYGFAVAADTGGGIQGNMIDLGYPDGVAVDWTSRWVEIYILGP